MPEKLTDKYVTAWGNFGIDIGQYDTQNSHIRKIYFQSFEELLSLSKPARKKLYKHSSKNKNKSIGDNKILKESHSVI
jgi:hypothetical protein